MQWRGGCVSERCPVSFVRLFLREFEAQKKVLPRRLGRRRKKENQEGGETGGCNNFHGEGSTSSIVSFAKRSRWHGVWRRLTVVEIMGLTGSRDGMMNTIKTTDTGSNMTMI